MLQTFRILGVIVLSITFISSPALSKKLPPQKDKKSVVPPTTKKEKVTLKEKKAAPKKKKAPNILSLFTKFKSFDLALKEAKKQNKPIFVLVHAKWNWDSKQLLKKTLPHPLISALLHQFLLVQFESDKPEGKKLVKKFKLYNLPGVVMFDTQGNLRERTVLYHAPRYFRVAIMAGLGQGKTFAEFKAQVAKEPKNLKAQLELAERALLQRDRRIAFKLFYSLWKKDPKNKKQVGAQALIGFIRLLVRASRYARCQKLLEGFIKQLPKETPVHIEAYRLLLRIYKLIDLDKKYNALLKVFHKKYPGMSPTFM